MQEFKVGDLVVSTAGHDMGQFYVIVEILDKNYVALADGKNKPITSPKKKKSNIFCRLDKKMTILKKKSRRKMLTATRISKKF